MSTMSPAQEALTSEASKRVRSAIDKRDRDLREFIEKYDYACEHEDHDEIAGAGMALMIMCSLGDPVQEEVRKWAQMMESLKRAEGATT